MVCTATVADVLDDPRSVSEASANAVDEAFKAKAIEEVGTSEVIAEDEL